MNNHDDNVIGECYPQTDEVVGREKCAIAKEEKVGQAIYK